MKLGWFILGLLFGLSGCIYLYKEIKFILKCRDMLIISYARLLYAFTFGIIPCLLCWMYTFAGIEIKLKTLVAVDYSAQGFDALLIFWLASVVGYIMLNLGYRRKVKFCIGKRKLNNNRLKHHKELSEMQNFCVAGLCLLLGFISLYLWTLNEGNIFNFIVKANWYRADYTNSQENAYAMFKQPAKLVQISTYLFFFQLIQKECRHKVLYSLGYLLSLVASILYCLCTDGRLNMAMFFGIQLLGFILYRRKDFSLKPKHIITLAILGITALVLIAKLDEITSFIRTGLITKSNSSENGIYMSLMSEFGYIYESGQMSIKTNVFGQGKYMIVNEIVRGIFSCLPSRFTPVGYETVWRYNTYLCTGNELAGTIPCDIISESIYDLGLIGVVIIPWFWGKVMFLVESAYSGRKDTAFNRASYMILVLAFFRLINYCGLYDFFRGLFAFLVAWIISLVVRKLSFRKTKI